MNKKMKQVRPEDFDVEALMAAAREGRLYIDASKNEVSKEQIIIKVRAYVGRIKVFATPKCFSSVDELWERILACDEFVLFLTPSNKAKICRDFDKYNLMRIIGVLREKGVYEQYSDYKFHKLLEQTEKDSPYRKYIGKGIENEQHALLVKIREIVEKYKL
jgi:hypothetical protein